MYGTDKWLMTDNIRLFEFQGYQVNLEQTTRWPALHLLDASGQCYRYPELGMAVVEKVAREPRALDLQVQGALLRCI